LLGIDAVPVAELAAPETEPEREVLFAARVAPDAGWSGRGGDDAAPPASVDRADAASPAASSTPLTRLTRDEKIVQLDALNRSEVEGCTRCELCRGRTQTVFGVGEPDARLMFVGEGPGRDEDLQGEPFVGKAGQLLNKQIAAMGLSREQVYIANVVKCRPPENRTPTPAEAATCGAYLRRQIAIVQPEIIVTLGGPAMKFLLNTTRGITAMRGRWETYRDPERPGFETPVMPTFHPSFLLRQYTVENRKKVWSDLQAVMQRLGL